MESMQTRRNETKNKARRMSNDTKQTMDKGMNEWISKEINECQNDRKSGCIEGWLQVTHRCTHTHTHTYAHRANVIIDWYRRASCVQSNEITVDLLISQHIVKLGRFVFLWLIVCHHSCTTITQTRSYRGCVICATCLCKLFLPVQWGGSITIEDDR